MALYLVVIDFGLAIGRSFFMPAKLAFAIFEGGDADGNAKTEEIQADKVQGKRQPV